MSPSVGISLYPGNGDDMATLLRHADAAMYKAKGPGRPDTFTFFDPEMGRHVRRLTIEGDRAALRRL